MMTKKTNHNSKISIIIGFLILLGITEETLAQGSIHWASEVISFSSEFSAEGNSAKQILGVPNAFPDYGEHPMAWTPFGWNKTEYIHVGFAAPIAAKQLVIVEILNSSSIRDIFVYTENGKEIRVYAGKSQGRETSSKILYLPIFKIKERIASVKIYVSGKTNYGIDAVGLSTTTAPVLPKVDVLPFINLNVKPEVINDNKAVLQPSEGTYFHIESPKREESYTLLNSNRLTNQLPWAKTKPESKSIRVREAYKILANTSLKPVKLFKGKHPSSYGIMTKDKRHLIFDMQSSFEDKNRDLYIINKNDGVNWSKVIKLSSILNTEANEMYPVLSEDEKTLYFSSNGFSGFGGQDIYASHRLDDTWLNWSTPENLGPIINTKDDEHTITLIPEKKSGIVTRDLGNRNALRFFSFNLPLVLVPKEWVKISGDIPSTYIETPASASIVFLEEGNPKKKHSVMADHEGHFEVLLPKVKYYQYSLEIASLPEIRSTINLEHVNAHHILKQDVNKTPEETILEELSRTNATFLNPHHTIQFKTDLYKNSIAYSSAQVKPLEINFTDKIDSVPASVKTETANHVKQDDIQTETQSSTINSSSESAANYTVQFEFDSFYLSKTALKRLDKLSEELERFPNYKLEIQGHTSRDEHKDALELSKQRADKVLTYLKTLGVDPNQVTIRAFGSKIPVSSDDSEIVRRINRRVELIVTW